MTSDEFAEALARLVGEVEDSGLTREPLNVLENELEAIRGADD